MIRLDFKAHLRCDYKDCPTSIELDLVLLPTGAFLPDIQPERMGHWQLLVDQRNPLMPYQGRCPAHPAGKIETVPNQLIVP